MEETVQSIGKDMSIRCGVIIGGESLFLQEKMMRKGIDIVIATPGRLLDHFERGNLILHGVDTLVMDEADRMLDMGFIPDIERIMELLTAHAYQVLCFSATMPPPIKKLIDTFLKFPHHVQVAAKIQSAANIDQHFIRNAGVGRAKRANLRALIKKYKIDSAIIFCNRKSDVSYLAKSLCRYDLSAADMHGDLTQSQRTKTLDGFKDGSVKYLIASDLAARGIDIQEMPCVINFDLPFNSEEYVHRVGRTGRAGRSGSAYSFIDEDHEQTFDKIKKFVASGLQFIDAEEELVHDPFKALGFRKPTKVRSFSFPDKKVKGFGDDVPDFMQAGT